MAQRQASSIARRVEWVPARWTSRVPAQTRRAPLPIAFLAPTILSRDGPVLFATRMARKFAYGFVSIILVVNLAAIGFYGWHIGLVLTLTLVGDAAIRLVAHDPC